MSLGALDAMSAYSRVGAAGAGIPTQTLRPAPSLGASEEPQSFGGMVTDLITDTSAKLHTAEQESMKQVAGEGNIIDMVTAIGAAETALDTVVAVRDKVVSAYGEVMRMQV
ncbi:flagellar hook-basal body complex protein FliE [Erythrobacter aureus]|uniref:Flagellar hook-basal body complex protein FliE n=1 Tax=Erythrobacter aureus TaxID=2182384 RepID=A0A345YIE6_9SPHN|nr:flagellar hook-basal body complex protein FliE [Erythrobacter aureus]AXK43698.1 flagellar hook-basal body complex protein FliE [Erythrobacter aureus]